MTATQECAGQTPEKVEKDDLYRNLSHRPFTKDLIPRLMEMTKGVYGGHDYIASCVDDWMNRPTDLFLGWFYKEELLIGVACTTVVEDYPERVAEFRGLRIAPEFKQMGLATHIQQQMSDELLRSWTPPKLETSTRISENKKVAVVRGAIYRSPGHMVTAKIAERTGFKEAHHKRFARVNLDQVRRLCREFQTRSLSGTNVELREGTYEPFMSMDDYYHVAWVVHSTTPDALAHMEKHRYLYTVDSSTNEHLAYSIGVISYSRTEGQVLEIGLGKMCFNDMLVHLNDQLLWAEKEYGIDKQNHISLFMDKDGFDEQAFHNCNLLNSRNMILGLATVIEKRL